MNQQVEQMIEQSSQDQSLQSSLDNWQTLIQASSTSSAEQNPNGFKSQGKWQFELKSKQLKHLHTHVVDLIKNQFGLQDDDLEIQFNKQIGNINQVFNFVGIQSQLKDQNQWKQNYGIWEITDFRVSVKDGNTTIVDFKNEDYHFVFFYETSLKNATFSNQGF